MKNNFNINGAAVVQLTNKLEQLNRSALPVAVRQTLNSAAFDVKQNTMPASANKEFVNRKKNFFKSKSKVQVARGFDIENMQAVVGFVGNDQAIDDLEQQERGGTIGSRGFIPLDTARTSNSSSKPIRAKDRLANKKIINSNRGRFSDKQNFIRAAVKAYQQDALVIGNTDTQLVFRVVDITPIGLSRDGVKLKLSPLYTFEDGRKVTVKATHFMETAAMESAKKLPAHFAKHAEAQFKKALKL